MRTIWWFIHFWLYLIAVEPWLWKARRLEKQGKREEHDALVKKIVKRWARSMIATAGGRVSVEGMENIPSEPAIYVSNHLGYFDIPLVLAYLGDEPRPLIAKKQIQKIPMIRGWMKELHCIFIDRDNYRESVKALREAEEWVAQGYSMVVFPEGTRSVDGQVHAFKAGAFRVAQKNRAPVVPFVIRGTDGLMPKGSLRIHPAAVSLSVQPAIVTRNFEKKDWRELPEQAREKVALALAREETSGSETILPI